MSLDPRSRERLEALGRRLPQPLPSPAPAPKPASAADAPRHRVEIEEEPEQLFRELMAASPDGSVPPHLLERLRELEGRRRSAPAPVAKASLPPGPRPGRRPAGRAAEREEDRELYSTFAELLREQDEDEDS
jgi:hypothetical protein